MALPEIQTPEFVTHIPSTNEVITFRPFLMKEQKVLMMAKEGEDSDEMARAVLKILRSCILTEGVDIDSLASFDIEYLFLQINSKSNGEVSSIKVKHDAEDCGHFTPVDVDVEQIAPPEVPENPEFKVAINDKIGIKFSYPTLKTIIATQKEPENKQVFSLIMKCVDYIYTDEDIFDSYTPAELEDWMGGLSKKNVEDIMAFFNSIPKLSHKIDVTCQGCGEKYTVTLEGLTNFLS